MASSHLLMWLEGPLQAWGHDSRFGRRDSLDFPTKSGVLGLICSARGAGGEEIDFLARWGQLDLEVIAYGRSDHNGEVLRQPLLRDFQMVGSGFDSTDPWQSLLIPKTNLGKKAVGGGSKLTYRYYIQDMAYACILQVPSDEIDAIAEALQNPVWDLYLGRKSCPPTEFIFQGVFTSQDEALDQAKKLADEKQRTPLFKVTEKPAEGEVLSLNDVPVRFGSEKQYRDRRVTVTPA